MNHRESFTGFPLICYNNNKVIHKITPSNQLVKEEIMSYIQTIQELVLDVETLYKDLSDLTDRETIKDFVIQNISDYVDHSNSGCEIMSYEKEDGETFQKDQSVIDRICEGKIVEIVLNKNPQWLSDDPFEFHSTHINNWIECDWDQLVDDYITWKSDSEG